MYEVFDSEISRLILCMRDLDPASEDYSRIHSQLVKLIATQRELENNPSKLDKVLTNGPLITGATQILATILILNYEKLGIVTSKAANFIKIR